MFQAVIFDNDGVLVDSEPLHHRAEAATLRHFGVELEEEFFKAYVGVGMTQMLTDCIGKFQLNAPLQAMIQFHEKNLLKIFQAEVTPTPHVLPLLEYLHTRKYRLAVASSSNRALVEAGLRKLGIIARFDSILCGNEITRLKPDPEIYLTTAARIQVAPADCLVIEDSSVGVKAAKAAGMFCVGYRNENSGNQDLSPADRIISDFRELTANHTLQL